MSTQEQAAKLRAELAQHCNNKTIYRHSLVRQVLYTEGFKHFITEAGAYWFLDILATEPAILNEAAEFAVVKLYVANGKARIEVTDGGKHGAREVQVFLRHISFTDCPPGDWEFYFENLTIMLPGER